MRWGEGAGGGCERHATRGGRGQGTKHALAETRGPEPRAPMSFSQRRAASRQRKKPTSSTQGRPQHTTTTAQPQPPLHPSSFPLASGCCTASGASSLLAAAAQPYPRCMSVLMLNPSVGMISSMSSPLNLRRMVVLPALSSPLGERREAARATALRVGPGAFI